MMVGTGSTRSGEIIRRDERRLQDVLEVVLDGPLEDATAGIVIGGLTRGAADRGVKTAPLGGRAAVVGRLRSSYWGVTRGGTPTTV